MFYELLCLLHLIASQATKENFLTFQAISIRQWKSHSLLPTKKKTNVVDGIHALEFNFEKAIKGHK